MSKPTFTRNAIKKPEEPEQEEDDFIKTRVALKTVVIDTPALLNMIKHCHDSKETLTTGQTLSGPNALEFQNGLGGARGTIMGVLKKDLENFNIFITQTTPGLANQSSISELRGENKDQAAEEVKTGTIGFYVSCQMGLAFTHKNLVNLIHQYRNFRNSFMIVYDLNKSQIGLNPVTCFRLSTQSIEALNLNNLIAITDKLVQDRIKETNLAIENMFEEVPLKIHRSHLLQAFLFDHIQPHMPSFNPNLLKMGSSNTHMAQLLYQGTEKTQLLIEELAKVEAQHKNQIKTAKKNLKKIQAKILENKDKTAKGSLGEKEDREALENMKVDDSTHDKLDLFLFSKQVSELCS